MNVGMTQFINTGADEDILKSLPVDNCPDELVKAMNRQGLVQKEVTVQGANGKTFTRKQWVRASDAPGSGQQKGSSQEAIDTSKIRGNFYGTGNFYEVGKSGNFQRDMQVLDSKPNGVTVRIRHADKTETYAQKVGNDTWMTDTGAKLTTNFIVSSAYTDDAKVTLNSMVRSKPENEPTQATSDTVIGKIKSYEGKSQAEMRVIFDGKTADVANQEIARIYKEMGSPQGNSRNYTLFQHATQPLSRLIFDAINNGTGDSTQDQSTLIKTSKIKASAGDKTIAAGKQQMQKDRTNAAQKKDTTSNGKLQPMPPDQKKKIDKLVHDLSHASKTPTAQPDGKKNPQNTQAPAKDSSSGIAFDKPADGDTKKAVMDMLASGKSRDDIMSAAKAAGITWKENDNAGINWMRASMAIQKHMKESKPTEAAGNGSQSSAIPAQQTPSGGKKPKVFTDDGGIANVSRGGRNGQYMITRKGKKQYIMLQATKKDGSWGKPSRVELFGNETPDDALKRMQRNNPDHKWQFDPDSMED